MAEYIIDGTRFDSGAEDLQTILAKLYADKKRPHCLCIEPAPAMYIAKVGEKHHLKRMPNTGPHHDPNCDSYEPPAELSGLGEVVGSAIQEDPESGVTNLKLDFSLTKIGGRSAPVATGAEQDSVRTDGQKLTLRGTLHYLWDQAGFTKWMPGMAGKRTWPVIRKYLLQGVEGKNTKGHPLSDRLYVPEPFNIEKKDEIAARRTAKLMKASASGPKQLYIIIGEVKELTTARYGFKMVIKHLPDFPLMMAEDLNRRLQKRFASELGLWDAIEDAHLLTIGTFSVSSNGVASLEEVALMLVDDNWIPFETMFEKTLVDLLIKGRHRFVKGLRYNLPSTKPLASAVLSDNDKEPVAMYIVPPDADDDYHAALSELLDGSRLKPWIWNTGEGEMPAIPTARTV